MIKDNKVCILCGKKYSFCNRCEEYDHLPRWMAIYCSENCKDIFNIISGYNMKLKTKEEAANALGKCNLSKKDQFNKACQGYINEILDTKEETVQEPVVVNTIFGTNEFAEAKAETEPQDKPKRMRNVKRK